MKEGVETVKPLPDRVRLISAFLNAERAERVGFLTMGKLRFEIEQTLSPGEEIFVVLKEARASQSSISNAKYGRDAWMLVVEGKIAERDFWQLGFNECRAVSRLMSCVDPLGIVRAGVEVGLEHEQIVALGKWNLQGEELNALAKKCAERMLAHSAIAGGALTGVLPKSNSQRSDFIGSHGGFQGPGRPVAEILRWSAKIGGPDGIDRMDLAAVKRLGDTFLPLLPILAAIRNRLRSEKVCHPAANRGGIVRAEVQ